MGEIVDELPIYREEYAHERGRSPTNRMDRIANQIAKSQNKALIKGQIRHELGTFATKIARKQQELTRAFSANPAEVRKKTTRTFDDIVAMTEAMGEEPIIKRKTVPFGASLQKQRVNSAGLARDRFGGRPLAA